MNGVGDMGVQLRCVNVCNFPRAHWSGDKPLHYTDYSRQYCVTQSATFIVVNRSSLKRSIKLSWATELHFGFIGILCFFDLITLQRLHSDSFKLNVNNFPTAESREKTFAFPNKLAINNFVDKQFIGKWKLNFSWRGKSCLHKVLSN